MYICKYFRLEELLPKVIYEDEEVPNKYSFWLMFDENLLYVIDRLRDDYGAMNCNTWLWGGRSHLRGFRPFNVKDTGAKLSQHKFGRGVDLIPKYIHPDKIREDIRNRKRSYMEKIKAIETNIDWLHIDFRNNNGKLIEFDPS